MISAIESRPTIPIRDADTMDEACARALESAALMIQRMEQLPIVIESPILELWDDLEILLEDIAGPASLLSSVHPDSAVRDAAEDVVLRVTSFGIDMFQNHALYERVRGVSPATAAGEQLRSDLIDGFEDNGVTLPLESRVRFKEISNRITDLAQQFEKNIRDNDTVLTFRQTELDGVPQSFADRLPRDADGNFLVALDAALFTPIITYAISTDTRHRLYVAYQNRGTTANLEILDEIVNLRQEIAGLYGVPSYAHHVTARRMAGSPSEVERFLGEVGTIVTAAEKEELDNLRTLMPEPNATLERWDVPYYSEKLRSARFAIDQEALRQYFPPEATLAWLMAISGDLYGIRFEKAQAPVWHEEVQYFEVFDRADGSFIGGIYLDLFPRENKFKHAAAWPVRGVSTRRDRSPISVLVTNFDRTGFTHGEVETFFHEFGHVLHGVLSRTNYNHHAGTGVQRDFVEAPSQMYEAWCREVSTLARMRDHCSSCPIIDAEMAARLASARVFGSGIRYARQHLYASFDMMLAGSAPDRALEGWAAMESATTLGYVPKTEFPATFAHITGGYAAGYYGYMWSEVIAIDLLSQFKGNLMDPVVGRRFRDTILSRGGERPARELVENFLGREASSEAFFEMLSKKAKNET